MIIRNRTHLRAVGVVAGKRVRLTAARAGIDTYDTAYIQLQSTVINMQSNCIFAFSNAYRPIH